MSAGSDLAMKTRMTSGLTALMYSSTILSMDIRLAASSTRGMASIFFGMNAPTQSLTFIEPPRLTSSIPAMALP